MGLMSMTRVAQFVVGLFELLPLEVAADEGLDDADGDEVFLDGVVQGVDLLLEAGEERFAGAHDEPEQQAHDGDDHDDDQR